MCSDKQRLSNQQNAKNSTGPTTPHGKSTSARNSLKHGLTAKSVVVLDERTRDFEEFSEAMRDDLSPRGALERTLVDRIILLNWKLQRVTSAEQVIYKNWSWKTLNQVSEEKTGWQIPVKSKVGDVLANEMNEPSSQLVRLQMYEVRIERQLHSCLRQLAAMRKMARDEAKRGRDGVDGHTRLAEASVQNEPSCEHAQSAEPRSDTRDKPLSRFDRGGGEGVPVQSEISNLEAQTTLSEPHAESGENEPSLVKEFEEIEADARASVELNEEKEITA